MPRGPCDICTLSSHSAEQSLKGFRHLRGRRNRCARCKPMERASGRATFWRSDPFNTMLWQPTAFKQYLKEACTATADPAIQHALASVIRANEAQSQNIRSPLRLHIKAIYYICMYICIPDIYVYVPYRQDEYFSSEQVHPMRLTATGISDEVDPMQNFQRFFWKSRCLPIGSRQCFHMDSMMSRC